MSDFTIHQPTYASLRIDGADGRGLLVIHDDGRVEGAIEDASEAAAVFVRSLREQWGMTPTAKADPEVDLDERSALGKTIWETSRLDEGSISATGAIIVADAILAAGFRRTTSAIAVPVTIDRDAAISLEHAIEQVVVDKHKIVTLGLSEDITDAVITHLAGWRRSFSSDEIHDAGMDARHAVDWRSYGLGDDEAAQDISHAITERAARSLAAQPVTDFEDKVHAERTRQIELGYTVEHDDKHGPDHLLMWAQEYLKRGETVKGAALVEAAREWYLRAVHRVTGAVQTPEALPDGTLALPCGSLWSVADRDAWRADHLPACALCSGNFGAGEAL